MLLGISKHPSLQLNIHCRCRCSGPPAPAPKLPSAPTSGRSTPQKPSSVHRAGTADIYPSRAPPSPPPAPPSPTRTERDHPAEASASRSADGKMLVGMLHAHEQATKALFDEVNEVKQRAPAITHSESITTLTLKEY